MEDGDGLFSPRVALTNVPPFNAPFPLSVPSSPLCVYIIYCYLMDVLFTVMGNFQMAE